MLGSRTKLAEAVGRRLQSTAYRRVLPALGLLNRRVNRAAIPVPDEALFDIAPVRQVSVPREAIEDFIREAGLSKYGGLPYLHSKPLEYFLTFKVWSTDAPNEARVLDAAGGVNAEYCRAIQRLVPTVRAVSQDALLSGSKVDEVEFIGGGVEALECESNSIDVVTCHHSVEHFRDDIDTAFVHECLRVLRPGGLLVIAPLFVAEQHLEFTNNRRVASQTGAVLDRSAAFAGWGPYERFARVYSADTLGSRLVAPARDLDASVTIVRLVVDGADVPDLIPNRHQVRLNRPLRALLIQKSR